MYRLLFKVLIIFHSGLLQLNAIASTYDGSLPAELKQIAKTQKCDIISEFYNRTGMVQPPYIYGVNKGLKANSAIFWCKNNSSKNIYKLVLVERDKSYVRFKISKSCSPLEKKGLPGGLSIRRKKIDLSKFFYYPKFDSKGPEGTVITQVVKSAYDGEGYLLYCYEGKWLFRTIE